jgi:hypothetical protein
MFPLPRHIDVAKVPNSRVAPIVGLSYPNDIDHK